MSLMNDRAFNAQGGNYQWEFIWQIPSNKRKHVLKQHHVPFQETKEMNFRLQNQHVSLEIIAISIYHVEISNLFHNPS